MSDLMGKRIPVLDQGWVELASVMGTDATVCDRARGTTGGPKKSSDRDLIRMMMRHHHGSSFEFCEIDIQVCCPFTVWRQMIRHRAGNIYDDMTCWDEPAVNELSGRYSEVPDLIQETSPDGWRRQSRSNRQGSEGSVTEWPEGPAYDHMPRPNPEMDESKRFKPADYLTVREREFHGIVRRFYDELLRFGVAKEQARKVWPMGGYTIGYMKMDLRNWLHWAALRLAPEAQLETREFAGVVYHEIVAPLFPMTAEAFETYTLNALTLSTLDQDVIRAIIGGRPVCESLSLIENKRERAECEAKLASLGFTEKP